jgi:hypothetical protein
MATACAIHYGLHVGMVIRYIKGEYVGESRNSDKILLAVSPYISKVDCKHIKRIIDQGCPSYLDFEEDYDNKHSVLKKGNQQTFLKHPEVTAKAMNKEEKIAMFYLSGIGSSISRPTVVQYCKGFVRNMRSTGSSLIHLRKQAQTKSC